MDASAARIQHLMAEACELLEALPRGRWADRSAQVDLLHIRNDLLCAADLTEDLPAADAAWGMSQAIDGVVERLRAASAAA